MASKVSSISKVIGTYRYEPGAHMYHAADATMAQGGSYNGDKQHKIRRALTKLRLRATGMTDSLIGSKETQGALENPYESAPKGERKHVSRSD